MVDALYNLRYSCRNAVEWFVKIDMQAKQGRFHFVLFSPTPTEKQVLQLCDGSSVMFETDVAVLGVTIDDEMCFFEAHQRLL